MDTLLNKTQYALFRKDYKVQERVRQRIQQTMSSAWKHRPDLLNLIPNWAVGCRIPSPSPSYISALIQPNVQVVTDTVERVTKNGLVVNGQVITVDAIICATGFDLSFLPQFTIVGRNGRDMKSQYYGDGRIPQSYMSIAFPKFPNYFGNPPAFRPS
jgi:cation diffusion facilitator CzcD-associated flavoprotein CzcO